MKRELIYSRYFWNKKSDQNKEENDNAAVQLIDSPQLHLKAYESVYFNEIQNSMAIFVDECKLPVSGHETNLLAITNIYSSYIGYVIKYCKRFAAFRGLPAEDQLIVLKNCFQEMLTIRSAFNYNPEKDEILAIAV